MTDHHHHHHQHSVTVYCYDSKGFFTHSREATVDHRGNLSDFNDHSETTQAVPKYNDLTHAAKFEDECWWILPITAEQLEKVKKIKVKEFKDAMAAKLLDLSTIYDAKVVKCVGISATGVTVLKTIADEAIHLPDVLSGKLPASLAMPATRAAAMARNLSLEECSSMFRQEFVNASEGLGEITGYYYSHRAVITGFLSIEDIKAYDLSTGWGRY